LKNELKHNKKCIANLPIDAEKSRVKMAGKLITCGRLMYAGHFQPFRLSHFDGPYQSLPTRELVAKETESLWNN